MRTRILTTLCVAALAAACSSQPESTAPAADAPAPAPAAPPPSGPRVYVTNEVSGDVSVIVMLAAPPSK